MADGVLLNSMTGGDVAAADEVAGQKYQRMKRSVGADGLASDFLDKLSGSDQFTASGVGATRDCSAQGMSRFALQTKQTGTVNSWTIDLQVSLDGTNWVTLISHTKAGDGDGAIIYSGPNLYPALYFRANCSALSLGAGTNVVVTILGLP
jgi:hypothetical protein